MIGGRSALLAAAGGGNPYGNWTGNYSDVSLLLRNGTPLLIPLDESPTPKAITAFGNASVTTAVVKYGTSAMAFDGSGDYFETPATTDFNFDNGPFTIEAWINAVVISSPVGNTIFSNMNGGWTSSPALAGYSFRVTSTGALNFEEFQSLSTLYSFTSAAGVITTGQWHHVAVCKEGTGANQVRLFRNGEIVATGTRDANIPFSTSGLLARIGANRQGAGTVPFFNGYIDDLRITKGVARYTKNFLPPPAELPAI